MGGEHSAMDKEGTADISPSARFGVTEAIVSNRLYEGLQKLYKIEAETSYEEGGCQLIWFIDYILLKTHSIKSYKNYQISSLIVLLR